MEFARSRIGAMVQRDAGAVREVLPAYGLTVGCGSWVAVADGAIELDRLRPPLGVVVPQPAPAGVAVASRVRLRSARAVMTLCAGHAIDMAL